VAPDFGDTWGWRMVLGGELEASSERAGGLLGGVAGGGPRGVIGEINGPEPVELFGGGPGVAPGGPAGVHGTVDGSNAAGPSTEELFGCDSPAIRHRYPSKPP